MYSQIIKSIINLQKLFAEINRLLDSGGRVALTIQTTKNRILRDMLPFFGENVARGSLVFSQRRKRGHLETKNRHDRALGSEVTPFGDK